MATTPVTKCTSPKMYISRTASGSRLGREYRQQQQQQQQDASSPGRGGGATVLEDSPLRRTTEATSVSGRNDGEPIYPSGGDSRVRAKSRRNKSRSSFEGRTEGGNTEQEQCWGDGISDQKPARSSNSSSSGKRDRRPKSQAKRRDQGAGERGAEGRAAPYPSLLDSALWKGGAEVDGGMSGNVEEIPSTSGANLYNGS